MWTLRHCLKTRIGCFFSHLVSRWSKRIRESVTPPPAAYNTVQNFDRRGRTRQILSTAVLQPTNFFCVFSECNCHGKAEECYFNQTVADLSLSLDIHGQYKGGGVCIGCRDDTAGINCQSCVPGFYRPADVRNLLMRVSVHYLNCCYLNMSAFSTCPGERWGGEPLHPLLLRPIWFHQPNVCRRFETSYAPYALSLTCTFCLVTWLSALFFLRII